MLSDTWLEKENGEHDLHLHDGSLTGNWDFVCLDNLPWSLCLEADHGSRSWFPFLVSLGWSTLSFLLILFIVLSSQFNLFLFGMSEVMSFLGSLVQIGALHELIM